VGVGVPRDIVGGGGENEDDVRRKDMTLNFELRGRFIKFWRRGRLERRRGGRF